MGLFSDKRAGRTPWQTLKSKLSVHVRTMGPQSEFVRTAPGRFYLRDLIDENVQIYESPPLRPPNPEENVLVFPSSALNEVGRFQGIKRNWRNIATYLFNPKLCKYIPRLIAERDSNHKQVLTYVMVCRGNQILAFKRGTYTWTEEFLRGSHCIGFGGHVTERDYDLFDRAWLGIKRNAARELTEELKIPRPDKSRLLLAEGLTCVGVLNDDSSDVGRRHFAFVFRYDVKDGPDWNNPERGEKAITQLRWLDMSAPKFSLREFEYWSQLCLRVYFKTVIKQQPSYLIRRHSPLAPPHILCIVGPIGSGKTETSAVLKKDYGYSEINSGCVVAGLLGIPPVPKTPRELFQAKAMEYISRPSGPLRMAKTILSLAKRYKTPKVLVDGIRQKETLIALKELAKGVRIGVLYVHTSPDLAYKFQAERDGNAISMEEFFANRDNPVERDVAGMLPHADGVLYNWEGRPMYRRSIHQMMRDLRLKPL
jgi:predicted NUDIX family phosphoesterase